MPAFVFLFQLESLEVQVDHQRNGFLAHATIFFE